MTPNRCSLSMIPLLPPPDGTVRLFSYHHPPAGVKHNLSGQQFWKSTRFSPLDAGFIDLLAQVWRDE